MARGSGAAWSDEGATLGTSLRSTRGPTSGWRQLAGSLLGLDAVAVSVVLSLAGLFCAVELVVSAGQSTLATGEAESAPAGLFRQGEAGKSEETGGGQSGGERGKTEGARKRKKTSAVL